MSEHSNTQRLRFLDTSGGLKMTKKEIQAAIKDTMDRIKTASGIELFRLEEELETLRFLYLRRV